MTDRSSIAAIATPQAPSALGIIRCSGPLSKEIFSGLIPRQASLKKYTSKEGVLLDEVVATVYEEKKSYTGEWSLEITCHGNPYILRKILDDLIVRDFLLAEPGEFTRRAFLNGRIDLTQAEAIANLISAHSDRALQAAHRQLAGELGNSIKSFSEELLSLIAQVEATIDFPEEDVPLHLPPEKEFDALLKKLILLRSTQKAHHLTFEGAKVALVGLVNAGKSSLFNALLGHDRALVSPIAGTTRDYLSAQMTLGPHWITLIDTAGLNPAAAHGSLEAMGIEKTKDQLATADIVLLIADGTDPLAQKSAREVVKDSSVTSLKVLTKADLPKFTATKDSIAVSAVTGSGIDTLKNAIIDQLNTLMPETESLMISTRHAAVLDECIKQLSLAQELLQKKSDPALIAHHLHSALNYLGEILGRFDNEQVLDKLFSQFCIGK